MKKTSSAITLGLLAAMLALASCNTMSGIGEDVSAGGKKLDESATKHKNY